MKLIVLSLLCGVCLSAKLNPNYLPPRSAATAGGSGNFLNAPPTGSGNVAAPVAILRLTNDNNGEGSYRYDFETENHISQQESGSLKNEETLAAQGFYSFQSPEGQVFSVSYVADENGFQAQGDHIPTPPPVPVDILKALEQNAADEAKGIFDDGQYRPGSDEGQYAPGNAVPSKSSGGYRY